MLFSGILLFAVLVTVGLLWLFVPVKKSAQETKSPAPSPPKNTAIAHVVLIVEENKTASEIIDSPQAPYINQLINQGALATNYSAVTNPSLPNYIILTSGSAAGITSDCNPPGRTCQAAVKSIADSIEGSGRSWKMYAEDMPSSCFIGNVGKYVVKHNPFVYYPDIRNDEARCNSHVVPLTQFSDDLNSSKLPNYVFITPNVCSDMHDCSVKTGDDWLSQNVPKILSSDAFTKERSLLIVTWDEGNTSDNKVVALFAGSAAKSGYTTDAAYNHYSLLRTIEDQWGLKPLTLNDQQAQPMNNMIK